MRKKQLKSIKELCPKPSDAVMAMVNGLRKQSKRKNFRIRFSSFGSREYADGTDKIICFGCAATSAIQFIANKNFTGEEIDTRAERGEFLGFDKNELQDFEEAIDNLRNGWVRALFFFYGLNYSDYFALLQPMKERLEDLHDLNWKEEIHHYEDFANKLKEIGL